MVSLTVTTPGFVQEFGVQPQTINSGTGTNATFNVGNVFNYQAKAVNTMYVFDAVLELEHNQRMIKTQHPVQTGANISSHAFKLPARLLMYVGMSDAMAAAVQWPGNNKSKSVSAYQTILALEKARTLITVTTRLQTYRNMLITDISPRESAQTIAGLRARIEFEEVMLATVSEGPATSSARPNDTNSTGLGVQDTAPVPPSIDKQYAVPPRGTFGQPGYSSVSGPQQVQVGTDVGVQ